MAASKKAKTRVLIFPCGSENASEIHQALRYSVHVELFGASSVDDHGRFRFQNYFGGLPNIRDAEFDGAFRALIENQGIEVVFSTHDTVSEYLAERAAGMGFYLVNGDKASTRIARRKTETYRMFADRPWIPCVFPSIALVDTWPVIVKPDFGQGGQGICLAHNPVEASLAMEKLPDGFLVEYLPGDEITVDCFTDRHRNLILVGPRTRERVKAGITMRSEYLEPSSEVMEIATAINARLHLRGPWFFQLKRACDGRWKLLEISCRVAGSMVAQRARGINLPLLAVLDYLDRDVIAWPEPRIKLIDRNIATRSELRFDFDTVYVDLDDTLLCDGYATPRVMSFLYQMLADKKRLVLITRHEFDVARTLERARISVALFDEIIHITDGRPKSDFITGRSIFIDNHFPERKSVAERHFIPVFDVDAIEFLER